MQNTTGRKAHGTAGSKGRKFKRTKVPEIFGNIGKGREANRINAVSSGVFTK